MCHPPRHELGDHEAGLYRFSEAYAIPTKEPDAARVKGAYHGYELVGLNAETCRLHS